MVPELANISIFLVVSTKFDIFYFQIIWLKKRRKSDVHCPPWIQHQKDLKIWLIRGVAFGVRGLTTEGQTTAIQMHC
jgi:hypothetical protein